MPFKPLDIPHVSAHLSFLEKHTRSVNKRKTSRIFVRSTVRLPLPALFSSSVVVRGWFFFLCVSVYFFFFYVECLWDLSVFETARRLSDGLTGIVGC